ncbi:hypothetical protein JOC55_006535, partial [Paenibacillus sacheonensis]|nr:hypothetical protein [Paenibacillus sacheonensis]
MPLPLAAVFHPANVLPVFTKPPVSPNTVTVAWCAYGLLSVGTIPPVLPLPLYVTVYVGSAVHCAYSVTFAAAMV